MTPIPTDEALSHAYLDGTDCQRDGLRVVARLVADETARFIDNNLAHHGLSVRASERQQLRRDFPSAFATPAPAKETNVTTPTVQPAPDEATVIHKCIDALRRDGGSEFYQAAIAVLTNLLPTPEPPLPTQYRELAGADYPTLEVVSLDTIKRRHGLLTPEEALKAVRELGSFISLSAEGELLAALRLAAKGEVSK